MKSNTRYLTINGLLIACAIAIQIVGRNIPTISQGFVGPIINAILIISVLTTNLKYASMIAIITPITALLTAQLNPAMGFFVPFICIGNVIYVVLFGVFKSYGKPVIANIIKVCVAAVGKYLFLSLAATKVVVLLNLGVEPKILEKLAIAMGVPQLSTALVGGIFALVIYSLIEDKIKKREIQ